MASLYLIRGLPGSGKSTFAAKLAQMTGGCKFEADDFFLQDGSYVFRPSLLGAAHASCKRNVRDMMAAGVDIIVANTFTTEKELKPYLAMAEESGYTVVSLVVENRHGNKSVHDVPEQTLDKMRARFSMRL